MIILLKKSTDMMKFAWKYQIVLLRTCKNNSAIHMGAQETPVIKAIYVKRAKLGECVSQYLSQDIL